MGVMIRTPRKPLSWWGALVMLLVAVAMNAADRIKRQMR